MTGRILTSISVLALLAGPALAAEEGKEEGILESPETWVAVAFVFFLVALFKPIRNMLTGTLDRCRIIFAPKKRGIIDLKTGKRAVVKGQAETSQHKAQIGTYQLLWEHTTGNEITGKSGVIGLRTSGNPEIGYGEVRNAKLAMVGTPDQPGWLQAAAEMFKTRIFPGNPASNLCSPQYCPRWKTCIFR